jgi:hypothetical protein
LSAPNKGKDLSALKARLASKAGVATPPAGPSASEPQRAPARTVAQKPDSAPEPAFPSEPRAEARPQVSETTQKPSRAAPKRAAAALADEIGELSGETGSSQIGDPFAQRANFDPSVGLIGGGDDVDTRPKMPVGLIIAAAVAGLGVGLAFGWLGHSNVERKGRVETAIAKAAEMTDEVTKIKTARSTLAVGWADVAAVIEKDPVAGSEKLNELVRSSFQEHPKVDALFGWQLGSMGKRGITSTFSLYENASGLKRDLGRLAAYLQNQAGALKEEAGPQRLAAYWKAGDTDGASLVELVKPICGADIKTPEECAAGKTPIGYAVRATLGGQEINVEKENVRPLLPRGPIYNAVISSKPAVDARHRLEGLIAEVQARLEEMSKHEKNALDALGKYSESPTVDAQSVQPDAAAE